MLGLPPSPLAVISGCAMPVEDTGIAPTVKLVTLARIWQLTPLLALMVSDPSPLGSTRQATIDVRPPERGEVRSPGWTVSEAVVAPAAIGTVPKMKRVFCMLLMN